MLIMMLKKKNMNWKYVFYRVLKNIKSIKENTVFSVREYYYRFYRLNGDFNV